MYLFQTGYISVFHAMLRMFQDEAGDERDDIDVRTVGEYFQKFAPNKFIKYVNTSL